MKTFKFLTLSLTLLSFLSCLGMKTYKNKMMQTLEKNNIMQEPLLFQKTMTTNKFCSIPYGKTDKLDIEELKKPCFAEKLFGCLKYCTTSIKNNSHHIAHIAAALPFWHQGYQGIKYLYNAENTLGLIDQKYKLDHNDPVYHMFFELLKTQKIETEIPIFKMDYHNPFGINAGAVDDKWICLWEVFDSYSPEEKKHLLSHELTHIKYQDAHAGILAKIGAPIISYCTIKGSAKLTTLIIDKIRSYADPEEENEQRFFLLLKKIKNGINFVSESPVISPILQYTLSLYLLSKFCQFQETRADLEGALLAGTVKGGLSWLYNEAMGNYPRPTPPNLFTLLKIAPLTIINHVLGYRAHPSYGERMKNLIMFAQKTGLSGAEDYRIIGNTIIKTT